MKMALSTREKTRLLLGGSDNYNIWFHKHLLSGKVFKGINTMLYAFHKDKRKQDRNGNFFYLGVNHFEIRNYPDA